MLEWVPGGDPGFGPGRRLPVDLAIVDESSMLNPRLAEVLLEGLAETTHIVFVGDADQLPPIGAGKPFEDLIDSGVAPVVRLTQIFRQAARSMITTAAHEINQGRTPHLEPGPEQDRDFFFIERPSPERALETVVEVVAERAAESFRSRPDPRGADAGADVPRAGRDRRAERAPPGAPQPRRQEGDRRALPDRRPADPDPQLPRAGTDERLDRLPAAATIRDEEQIVVDTDEGGTLVMPLLGDGDPETAPTRSPSTRRRAARCRWSSPFATAPDTRMLTRPCSTPAITRARRNCVLVGDSAALASRREPRRKQQPPLRRCACAAAARRRSGPLHLPVPSVWQAHGRCPSRRRARGHPWLEIGLTVGGILLLGGSRRSLIPALRHAAVAAVHGETSEVRAQIKSLGAAGPLIIIGLAIIHSVVPVPGRDRERGGGGFAYGFWGGLAIVMRRLDALGDHLLLVRHRRGEAARSTAGSAPRASPSSREWSNAAASPC